MIEHRYLAEYHDDKGKWYDGEYTCSSNVCVADVEAVAHIMAELKNQGYTATCIIAVPDGTTVDGLGQLSDAALRDNVRMLYKKRLAG